MAKERVNEGMVELQDPEAIAADIADLINQLGRTDLTRSVAALDLPLHHLDQSDLLHLTASTNHFLTTLVHYLSEIHDSDNYIRTESEVSENKLSPVGSAVYELRFPLQKLYYLSHGSISNFKKYAPKANEIFRDPIGFFREMVKSTETKKIVDSIIVKQLESMAEESEEWIREHEDFISRMVPGKAKTQLAERGMPLAEEIRIAERAALKLTKAKVDEVVWYIFTAGVFLEMVCSIECERRGIFEAILTTEDREGISSRFTNKLRLRFAKGFKWKKDIFSDDQDVFDVAFENMIRDDDGEARGYTMAELTKAAEEMDIIAGKGKKAERKLTEADFAYHGETSQPGSSTKKGKERAYDPVPTRPEQRHPRENSA